MGSAEIEINNCWKEIGIWGDQSCKELLEYIRCVNCPFFSSAGKKLLDHTPPSGYIEEWGKALASKNFSDTKKYDSINVFRIGDEWFGLKSCFFLEVFEMKPVRRIPHRTNQILMGFVSVRGEIHICFSLASLFGISQDKESSPKEDRKKCLMLIKKDNFVSAFPVDEVIGIVRYSEKEQEEIPVTVQKSFKRFTKRLINLDNKKIGLLDENELFQALRQSIK